MYNSYFSSTTLFTLPTHGSLSFSFNDHSNLFSERFQKNPSSSQCCSCCNCSSFSSFPTKRVLITPNFFYGLRQSTLIQWSPCKRLIFRGRDPCCYRVPSSGCFDVSCSCGEKSGMERIETRREGRIRRLRLNRRECLSSGNDAEDVISFLSEECLGGGDRNEARFRKRVEMEKRRSCIGEKKNDGSSQFESAKSKYGRYRRQEERRRREERSSKEDRDEKEEKTRVSRKPSSSHSSYYSVSSTGDFGSDDVTQDENVGLLEASSSGYERDSWRRKDSFEEEVEEFERQEDTEQDEFLEKKSSIGRTSADWELRKKTEKRLTEIEETQSQRESSRLRSRIARTGESEKGKVASSYEQIGNEHGKLTMAANFEKGRTKKYIRKGDQEVTDMNTKSSLYQGQFIGREGDLKVDADLVEQKRGRYDERVDMSTGMGSRRNNLQQSQMSEIGNVVKKDTKLQSLSESRMKIREEDVALRSGWEASEKRQQAFKQITEQIESRSASRHSEISMNDNNSRKTSILQSETRIVKNQEGSVPSVSQSVEERKEQMPQAHQTVRQRILSGKGSVDVANIAVNVTNVSITHATDIERVNYTQVTSGRMTNQGSELVPAVNPIQEAIERDNQINESLTGLKTRDEALKATEVSCFQEQNLQLASGSHTNLDMVSQAQSEQVIAGGYRSSQPTMMPPSRQMVDRGSFHVNPISDVSTQEVSGEVSESSSSAISTYSEGKTLTSRQEPYGRGSREEVYGEAVNFETQNDTIVSAQRQEESSQKYVGEFIDMVKNGASTSEISDSNLEYEGEDDKRKKASHSGSEVSQLKKLDSRRPSGVSGAKGPSDEMWDVTDPSAQKPPTTEAPEDNAAMENTVARKSGKSLWGFISDVAQLRWGSRVETPKSTTRSGGKSSSNDSVSSETWFSGHGAEETSDKNVEKEKSMSKEATSAHRQQLTEASTQGQEEASDTLYSKSIIGQLAPNASSPSTTYISGSTSKGVSSPAEEENLVWGQDIKSFQRTQSLDGKSSYVSPPSRDAGGSSVLPLPSSGMSTRTGSSRTDASVGGIMEMKEQPLIANLTEVSGSEGKDGELKQRRLQRNKQVVKDKFDEWEEAYIRESEQRKIDEMFMREALLEAKKAADTWEVPVGAVLVQHGKIVARGYNLVEQLRDSTAHAEMICIREASNQLRSWRLAECTLYVTLEPCAMCAGAILQARIDTLVWGAPNKLLGADGSWIRLFPNSEGGNESEGRDKQAPPPHPFHPKMTIRRGVMESECADTMQQFFQLRRRKKVKNEDALSQPSLPIATHQSKFLRKMHDVFHAFLCM
ncbi:tRNA arginine adenosine deaminase [Euphorbia peplus]|nr:tRNA arginine adenosine deaminase [Euphorbia peplus]